MNERILDLAIKSGHIVGELPLNANEKIQLAGLKKFAELIVRECMDVASPSYMSTPEQGVYYVERAIDRIAEHFGVRE